MTNSKNNAIKQIANLGFIAILVYEAYYAFDSKNDILDLRQNIAFNLPYFLLCVLIFSSLFFLNKKTPEFETKEEKIPNTSTFPAKISNLFSFWKNLPLYVNFSVLLLSIIMGLLCFYDLGFFDILPDESLHINAAQGFNETGSFKKWDFLRNTAGETYNRAWSYTYLVAMSFKLFGVSVVNARIVSAIFGVLFVPIIFRISMYFTKSLKASFLTTLACMFCPLFLVYFRRIRMYAMLMPVFALFYYFALKVLNESSGRQKILNSSLLGKLLDFKFPLLLVTLFFLFLSYNVHQISLLSLVALFIYFFYLLSSQRSLRLVTIFVLGILCLLFFILKPEVSGDITKIFSLFKDYNRIYFVFLMQPLFSLNFTAAVLISGFLLFFKKGDKKILVALYAMVASTICIFVYCIQYDIHFRYISYTIPFFFLLIFYILNIYNNGIETKYLSFAFPILSILVILFQFNNSKASIYYQNPEAQFNAKVYKTMKRQFDPNSQQILALFPAEFYMDEMDPKTPLIDILRDQGMSLGQLNSILSKKTGTWVTWPTHKSRHLRQEVIERINNTCQKLHGYAIDNTYVELYYCTR